MRYFLDHEFSFQFLYHFFDMIITGGTSLFILIQIYIASVCNSTQQYKHMNGILNF